MNNSFNFLNDLKNSKNKRKQFASSHQNKNLPLKLH